MNRRAGKAEGECGESDVGAASYCVLVLASAAVPLAGLVAGAVLRLAAGRRARAQGSFLVGLGVANVIGYVGWCWS